MEVKDFDELIENIKSRFGILEDTDRDSLKKLEANLKAESEHEDSPTKEAIKIYAAISKPILYIGLSDNETLKEIRRIFWAIRYELEKLVIRSSKEPMGGLATAIKANILSISQEANPSLQRIEHERDRYKQLAFWTRIALSTFICLVGIAAILLLPSLLAWSWLEKHPDRIGLYACSIVMWIAMSYSLADWKRRMWSLGAVGLGALLVLLQILHN